MSPTFEQRQQSQVPQPKPLGELTDAELEHQRKATKALVVVLERGQNADLLSFMEWQACYRAIQQGSALLEAIHAEQVRRAMVALGHKVQEIVLPQKGDRRERQRGSTPAGAMEEEGTSPERRHEHVQP